MAISEGNLLVIRIIPLALQKEVTENPFIFLEKLHPKNSIEAKCAWDKNDYWKCVAETATLHKIRKDALKNSEVWGVLSNATDWVIF